MMDEKKPLLDTEGNPVAILGCQVFVDQSLPDAKEIEFGEFPRVGLRTIVVDKAESH